MKLITLIVVIFAVQAAVASNLAARLKQRATPADSLSGSSSVNNYLQSLAQSAGSQISAAAASASSEISAAAAESIPATKLIGQSGAAAEGSAADCGQSTCSGNAISWANSGAAGAGLTVDDAVKPIEDWMKDFKSRTANSGNDLLVTAKATIAPLLAKLKRNQIAAVEKLQMTNEEILRHVEETATEHVYNLLRAERIVEEKKEAVEAKKMRLDDVKAEAAEKEMETKILAESSESSQSKASF